MTHGAIVAVGVLPDPLAAELDARGGCRVPVSLDVPENLDRDAVRVIVASGSQILPTSWLDRFPNLAAIAVHGVGTDGIDRAAMDRRRVVVHTTPEALIGDVAEHAIGLLLALLRHIPANDRLVRSGAWRKETPPALGTRLAGRAIGFLGLGRIGQAIAGRLQSWDAEIHYSARNRRTDVPFRYHETAMELLAAVDTAFITVPGGIETTALVGARELAALGRNGVLINVARGSVVDPDALFQALNSGSILGAGLDVFDQEPAGALRFAPLANVILQPHQGSATIEAREAMKRSVLAAVRAHLVTADGGQAH